MKRQLADGTWVPVMDPILSNAASEFAAGVVGSILPENMIQEAWQEIESSYMVDKLSN
jgi:hypothetical protein